MPGDDSMEDEWEYEYDEIETESFYINLDLTSCNGVIRPPRVRSSSAANSKTQSTTTQEPTPSGDSPPLSPPEDQFDDDDLQVPDPEMAPQDEIQIMDLHTRNPIISYQNQIFSCSWADMIGTELLFSLPEGHSNLPTLRRNEEYDLISANRVKIIGKKGTLVASSFEGTEPANDPPAAELENPVPAAGEASTPVPTNQPPKRQLTNQARFIERLVNAKRARGENDAVRTVFSQKQSDEFQSRLRGWSKTQEQMAEYERLNRRVLQGDPDAQVALEELYEKMERESAAADDGMEGDSQPGPSHSHGDTTGVNETEDRNGNDNSSAIT